MNSHLLASHANCLSSIHYEPSANPNEKNRLHEDLKQGNKLIIPYCQKFNLNDTVQLQLCSDVITVPTLTAHRNKTGIGATIDTITGSLVETRTGAEGTRYYFNFDITFDSAYLEKIIYLKATQGSESLIFEPVWVSDLTTDLANHQILKIEYSNFDKFDTDLQDFLIDWENITTTDNILYFYVEAQDNDTSDQDESENLDGALNKTKISASNFFGNVLKTGLIPKHLYRKLELVSSLDFFAVNGIEYLKDGAVDAESKEGCTSVQCSVKLIDKIATGINIDNLSVEFMAQVIQVDGELHTAKSGAFDVAIPSGYMFHCAIAKFSSTSSGNPGILTIGSTLGGTEYVDETGGAIADSSYHTYNAHDLSAHVYFYVSGAGVKMDVYVQWLLQIYPD